MTEIVPDIFQLQFSPPSGYLEHVNAYLIKGDDGYLLIDTGWNTEEVFHSLKQQLDELHVNFTEIHQILITHIHPDHYGMAGRLKELSHAKITLHHLEGNLIKTRYANRDKLLNQINQWLRINGVPSNELIKLQMTPPEWIKSVIPVLPDVSLHGDETLTVNSFSFKVIWTPGHSPGHICLYEPTHKILISGDHILAATTPNISLNSQSSSNPLGDYLNSLGLVKQLEVNLVLPGHEKPFTGLRERVEELIRHHERRKSEILEILKTKPKTAYQVCLEMTWMLDTTPNGVLGYYLASWDKRMAVSETLAHLESLRVDGKVDKFHKDGIIFYQHT